MATQSTRHDVLVADALGTVAAAYVTALYQGKWVESSGLLSAFQQAFNEYRSSVVASFDEDASQANALLPQALPVDGMFRAPTRDALVGALIASGRDGGVMDSMPSNSAGAVADWASGALALVQRNEAFAINSMISQGVNAGREASEWIFSHVNGIATGGAEEVAREIIEATNPTPPQPSSSISEPTRLPTLVVTAQRRQPKSDLWTYFLWGALVAGGATTIYYVKRGKWPWERRRRRRRR